MNYVSLSYLPEDLKMSRWVNSKCRGWVEDKGPSSLSSCKLITTAEEHYRPFLIKETQESFFALESI